MRTMRQAYNTLIETNEVFSPELLSGKAALATQINAKGPLTPVTGNSALTDMATAVATILQESIEIDGGEMYAAQMTGDGKLWNLYTVLADIKNAFISANYLYNGNMYRYAACLVCEYYKGYDSLQLKGADAYYTCDGDFYPSSQPLHTWHDDDNGKVNRWVAFLYATEGATFEVGVNDTAISPRSIYVGGHIGTIGYNADGRLTELVSGVQETDVVDKLYLGAYTQEWNKNLILKGVGELKQLKVANGGIVVLDIDSVNKTPAFQYGGFIQCESKYIDITINGTLDLVGTGYQFIFTNNKTIGVKIRWRDAVISYSTMLYASIFKWTTSPSNNNTLNFIHVPDFIGGFKILEVLAGKYTVLEDVLVGAMEYDLDLPMWQPSFLSDATKKAKLVDNIVNHILARVSDRSETTFLNFTVSTDMCNGIKDELVEWPIGSGTQMTLYNAFQTKGWNLLGA